MCLSLLLEPIGTFVLIKEAKPKEGWLLLNKNLNTSQNSFKANQQTNIENDTTYVHEIIHKSDKKITPDSELVAKF